MPALTLALLGPLQVSRADGGAVAFRSRKYLVLLAYLAVEQRHSHSRETLLWPEAPEDAARGNLLVAVADLRRLLGEGGAGGGCGAGVAGRPALTGGDRAGAASAGG